MSLDSNQNDQQNRGGALARVFVVAVFGPLGLGMLLHGLGSTALAWLHPNPHLPNWIFVLVGLFVLSVVLAIILQAARAPAFVTNAIFWLAIATGFVMMNWMIFSDTGHARCFIAGIPFFGPYPQMLCDNMGRALVILVDAIAIFVAAAVLTGKLRRRDPQ